MHSELPYGKGGKMGNLDDISKPLFAFVFFMIVGVCFAWFLSEVKANDCNTPSAKQTVEKNAASDGANQKILGQRLTSHGNTIQDEPEPETNQPWKKVVCAATDGEFLAALVTFLVGWAAVGLGLVQVIFLWGTLQANLTNAKATKDSVKQMRFNAVTELRAYVGVVYPEIRIVSNNLLVASIDYQNSGKTPARQLQVKIANKICKGIPPWEDPPNSDEDWKGGILMPGAIWQRHSPVTQVDHFDGRWSNRLIPKEGEPDTEEKIWVWGTITFVDMFRDRWRVSFRFRSGTDVRSEGQRPSQWARKGQFIPLISEFANSRIELLGSEGES